MEKTRIPRNLEWGEAGRPILSNRDVNRLSQSIWGHVPEQRLGEYMPGEMVGIDITSDIFAFLYPAEYTKEGVTQTSPRKILRKFYRLPIVQDDQEGWVDRYDFNKSAKRKYFKRSQEFINEVTVLTELGKFANAGIINMGDGHLIAYLEKHYEEGEIATRTNFNMQYSNVADALVNFYRITGRAHGDFKYNNILVNNILPESQENPISLIDFGRSLGLETLIADTPYGQSDEEFGGRQNESLYRFDLKRFVFFLHSFNNIDPKDYIHTNILFAFFKSQEQSDNLLCSPHILAGIVGLMQEDRKVGYELAKFVAERPHMGKNNESVEDRLNEVMNLIDTPDMAKDIYRKLIGVDAPLGFDKEKMLADIKSELTKTPEQKAQEYLEQHRRLVSGEHQGQKRANGMFGTLGNLLGRVLGR